MEKAQLMLVLAWLQLYVFNCSVWATWQYSYVRFQYYTDDGNILFGVVQVTKWRPAQKIQVKVIGICVNKGRLLAMEVYDDQGDLKGVRPLGGMIEFGENRETALRREFQEELKTEIALSGPWRIFENLYVHEGKRGHEYIFGIGIQLLDSSLYTREVLVFSEDSGMTSAARWFSIDDLKRDEPVLFPLTLKDSFT